MGILHRIADGLAAGFQPEALLLIAIGIVAGIIVGALPGMGPTMGMAASVPFVLRGSPEQAIFLFTAIMVGANYGNSIPAILVKVPGTPAALLTVIEGYPFHRRGEGGRALMISLIASLVGQSFAVLVFIVAIVPISAWAVGFLFSELFALTVFGLLAALSLVSRNRVKGMIAICFGILLSTVGQDPVTGLTRFGFGSSELQLGLGLIPVLVGLLAAREVFLQVRRPQEIGRELPRQPLKMQWLSRADFKEIGIPTAIGAGIGTVIGALPGAGSSVASFITYQWTRIFSRKKHKFTKGSAEGLASVDSSQNAAQVSELIPTLGIGIPGAASMVIIMAVLTAQGVIPGPGILETRPELLYATFGGLMAATVFLAVLGYLMIWPAVYLTRLSRPAITATTLVLMVIGVYTLRASLFDVWLLIGAGVVGYVMTRFEYPVAPAALAFLLGPILESSLRRGLVMTDGFLGFVSRPITAVLLAAALFMLVGMPALTRALVRRGAEGGSSEDEEEALEGEEAAPRDKNEPGG